MKLELILLQGSNFKNEGIVESIDACEHALYYIDPESIISMSITPHTSPLTPWTSRDDPLNPLLNKSQKDPFAYNYEEHKNMMHGVMKNLYEGYKPDPYAALSQPITQASITPITPTIPMSAISVPSFLNSPNSLRKGIEFDGGITLYGCKNTAIFKEPLGYGFINIYSHHDNPNSLGRMELDLKTPWMEKGKKIFDYPKYKW